jgi:hypothetical protein
MLKTEPISCVSVSESQAWRIRSKISWATASVYSICLYGNGPLHF